MRSTLLPCLWSSILLLFLSALAQAQTWTWDGGNPSNSWSRGTNWIGDAAPTSGIDTALIFGTGPHTTLSQSINQQFILNQLTFAPEANAFSIGGGALEFRTSSSGQAPVLAMNSSANQRIVSDLVLANDLTVNGTGTGVLNLDGAISGAGSYIQSYAGEVTLTNAAGNTGGTFINGGTFSVNSGGKLTGGGPLQVASGGRMQITSGTVQVSSVTGAGRIEISEGTLTASGNLSGASGFRMVQTGGRVQAASLDLAAVGSSGTQYTMSGAASSLSITGLANLSYQGSFIQSDGQFSSGALSIAGSGSRRPTFTQSGGSVSTGAVTYYSTNWTQSGGTFQAASLSSTDNTGTTSSFDFSGGSQIYTNDAWFGSAGTLSFQLRGTAAMTVGGDLYLAGRTASITQSGGSLAAKSVALSSRRASEASYGLTGGTITTGEFFLNSPGAQYSQSGGTATVTDFVFNDTAQITLNGGLLKVNRIKSPDGSTIGTLNLNGGTLEARQSEAAFISGLADLNVHDGGAIIDSGSFDIKTAQNFIHGGTGAAIDGGLTKLGSGRLTLTGSNTYTGTTSISAGVLQIGDGGSTGDIGLGDLVNNATLVINRTGTVTLGGSLSGNGSIALTSGTLELNRGSGSNSISGAGSLIKSGPGTQTLGNLADFTGGMAVNGGTLLISKLGAGGSVNLNAGALEIGDNSTTARDFALSSGSLLRINSGTFLGTVSGLGAVEKTGSGTLMLGGVNSFTGGLLFSNGKVSVSSDSALGDASNRMTFSGGTLEFANNLATARDYNLNFSTLSAATGATVTYNGGRILGGYLGGPGIHVLGNETTLQGTTTQAGSYLKQLGGSATLNSATVRGNFDQAPGAVLSFTQGTIGTQATINVAGSMDVSGTDSYGKLNVLAGGTVSTSGLSLGLAAGSRTTIAAGGILAASNSGSIELSGLLTNNSTQTGPLNVNYGGKAKGGGKFGTVVVSEGGSFSPGNSPGTATVNDMTFTADSGFEFELNSTSADPGINQDFLNVVGNLDFDLGAGDSFTISLFTLNGSNNFALLSDFDPHQSYRFTFASAGSISGFSPSHFVFDTTGFLNNLDGGSFSVAQEGQSLNLMFTPVPEPGSLLLVGWTVIGVVVRRRSRGEA